MKKIFMILIVLVSTTLMTFAQCGSIQCSNQITLPLPTDQNLFNALNNLGGSRCINNNSGTNTIPNNFNWNNFAYLTFIGSGTINVLQTWNLQGQNVYIDINGTVNATAPNNFAGQHDTVFVMQGQLNMTVASANNLYNYAVISPGASLYINGSMYNPGDTYQHQGNSSNVIQILSGCGVSTPLAIVFEKFYAKGNRLFWVVAGIDPNSLIEIEYSSDAKEWNSKYSSYSHENSMIMLDAGFYRAKVEGTYSTIIAYKVDTQSTNKIRKSLQTIDGRDINTIDKPGLYIKDGQVIGVTR